MAWRRGLLPYEELLYNSSGSQWQSYLEFADEIIDTRAKILHGAN